MGKRLKGLKLSSSCWLLETFLLCVPQKELADWAIQIQLKTEDNFSQSKSVKSTEYSPRLKIEWSVFFAAPRGAPSSGRFFFPSACLFPLPVLLLPPHTHASPRSHMHMNPNFNVWTTITYNVEYEFHAGNPYCSERENRHPAAGVV